jgi:hypothetical protein
MTRILPWLVLLLGILQPLTGALAALGIGSPIGGDTAGTDAPEQPLPAFFAIWGVIFLAYSGFGVMGILRAPAWYPRVGWPMLAAGLSNVVWMLSAQLIGLQPLNFLLLAPIFAAAWIAAARAEALRNAERGTLTFRFADAASGLLAGWISVATAISVPLTIRTFTGLMPTDYVWPMFWSAVAVAALAAYLFASRVSRSLWFFVAMTWGLTGVAINNWVRTEMHLVAATAALGAATILLVRVTRPPKRFKSAA